MVAPMLSVTREMDAAAPLATAGDTATKPVRYATISLLADAGAAREFEAAVPILHLSAGPDRQ